MHLNTIHVTHMIYLEGIERTFPFVICLQTPVDNILFEAPHKQRDFLWHNCHLLPQLKRIQFA